MTSTLYYSFRDHPKFHKVLVTTANLKPCNLAFCQFFDRNGLEIENRIIKHPQASGKYFVLEVTDEQLTLMNSGGIVSHLWNSNKTYFNERVDVFHEKLEMA